MIHSKWCPQHSSQQKIRQQRAIIQSSDGRDGLALTEASHVKINTTNAMKCPSQSMFEPEDDIYSPEEDGVVICCNRFALVRQAARRPKKCKQVRQAHIQLHTMSCKQVDLTQANKLHRPTLGSYPHACALCIMSLRQHFMHAIGGKKDKGKSMPLGNHNRPLNGQPLNGNSSTLQVKIHGTQPPAVPEHKLSIWTPWDLI